MENKSLKKFRIKFTNKAISRPVRVKGIHDRHQINLVYKNKMSVIYKGKAYKYIFYLLTIFHVFTGYDLLKENIAVE